MNRLSLSVLVMLLFVGSYVNAQNKGISFQGVFQDPNGDFPTASGLTVRLQILDPVADCVLREEVHSAVDVTNGYMNLVIGSSSALVPAASNPSPIPSFQKVMDNSAPLIGFNCSYVPQAHHERKIRIITNMPRLAGGFDAVTADFNMRAVAFAMNSEMLNGKKEEDFLQVNPALGATQNHLEQLLNRYSQLDAILNGNYVGNAATATTALTANSATTATSATTAATAATANALRGFNVATTTPTAGQVLTWNAGSSSWEPSTSTGLVSSVAGRTGDVTLSASDVSGLDTFVDGRVTLQKGVASGLAPLNSSSKVSSSFLGTGTADASTYLRGDGTWSTISSSDATKLPLAGGTMTGDITMASGADLLVGGNSLQNVGYLTMNPSRSLHLSNNATDPAGLTLSDAGKMWYDSSNNVIKFWDGSAIRTLGVAGAGLQSLNGLNSPTQTFGVVNTGSDFAISSTGSTHSFQLPTASATARGALSSSDWSAFSSKLGPSTSFSGDVSGTYNNLTLATVPISKGGTGQTIKANAFNALSPLTTKGDLVVHNGANNVRLPAGSNMTYLRANSAVAEGVEWTSSISASEISSLVSTGIVQRNGAGNYSTVTVNAPLSYAGGVLAVATGTSSTTVAAGNDSRIVGALQKSGDTMTGDLTMDSGADLMLGGNSIQNVGYVTMNPSRSLHLSNNSTDPTGLILSDAGKMWYDSTNNVIKFWDGGAIRTLGVVGSGLSTSTSFAGDVSGTYNNLVLATVPISKGGTGQTTKTNSFNALSPLTTKGDLVIHNGTNSVRLPAGANMTYLRANSAAAEGVEWASSISASEISSLASTGIVQRNGAGNYSTVTVNAPLSYTGGILGVTTGTSSTTVAAGNDSRIVGALQKSGDTLTGTLNALDVNIANTRYLKLPESSDGSVAGQLWYNAGDIKYFDGTTTKTLKVVGTTPVDQGGTGVTSLNSGSLLLGNGINPVTTLNPVAGNIVYATGTTTWLSGSPDTANLVTKSLNQTITGLKTFTTFMNTKDIRYFDSDSSHYVGLKAPNTVLNSFTLSLPATAGSLGQALTHDGAGGLTWSNLPASSGPAGGTGRIQYNNGGSFGGTNLYTDGFKISLNSSEMKDYFYVEVQHGMQYNSSGAGVIPQYENSFFRVNNTSPSDNRAALHTFGVTNTATTSQNAYFGAVSTPTGHSPAIVIGQQNGSSSYEERFRIDASGNVGIGTVNPTYKLVVNGDINLLGGASALRFAGTGVCTSTGCTSSSDQRLKEKIEPLSDSLFKILQIQGVQYEYIDKEKFGSRRHIGVLAQDVEKVFPETVVTDEKSGLKSVAYDHLVAPIIEAIKSLYVEQEVQRKELTLLQKQNIDLKTENSAIKLYLCQKDPEAPFCN
ncbi:hypothetical protein AZI85_03740 [Bdellovibrio bacteriovorus]|uniref:Peptidase S74 domain-containing protein n=1 Tax=Bdellovibrio bacteriovorus TaxID=959 RepID=A0A150WL35_BDEBC|nr:tail fiber domain-containing protein [Bdellovibrio bacteriovorus]KYG64535.1 hypothetical protein AZI85_03740 [Bdellovibrio bacteriovorus]